MQSSYVTTPLIIYVLLHVRYLFFPLIIEIVNIKSNTGNDVFNMINVKYNCFIRNLRYIYITDVEHITAVEVSYGLNDTIATYYVFRYLMCLYTRSIRW